MFAGTLITTIIPSPPIPCQGQLKLRFQHDSQQRTVMNTVSIAVTYSVIVTGAVYRRPFVTMLVHRIASKTRLIA